MKKTIICLAMLVMVSVATAANVTNLFPNGDFESGGAGDWVEGGCDFFNYPAAEGNPGGYGIIDDSVNCWGIWVGGDSVPLSLASLGLTAGQTYTFVQDMKIISGTSIGGIKIESWTTNASGNWVHISNSGDMRPLSGTSEWATYAFSYTISPTARGLKVVPIWGPGSSVGFDNLGVVVVGVTPFSVSITSPTNNQTVYSNFTINATATISPGTVTNVGFYIDNALVGSATNSPFGSIATGVSAGAHALKVVARASNGDWATSSIVNVVVTNVAPPPVNAYEPFDYISLGNGTPATGAGFSGTWACGAAGNIVPGLTYPGLSTANSALQSSSSHQLASLSSPSAGDGTLWVSFLFRQVGDNGGNRDGFALLDSSGKGVMFAYQQFEATLGKPALTRVSSYTTVGTQFTPTSTGNQIYDTNNFYVLRLSYSGGSLSSVAVYSNPTAGLGTAPAADFTVSSGLSGIGALSLLGLVHQGAVSITVDELRVGSTYADVVGANFSPTIPTTLDLSVASSKRISWNASSTNYYQPQRSADNGNWTDVGGQLFGSTVTSVYDATPQTFYQVLEIAPINQEQSIDGGFETDGGSGLAFYWNSLGSQPPVRITSDFHGGSASMSLFVTNSGIAAQTSVLQQNLTFAGSSGITGGNTYSLSFWAKSLGKNPTGGYVQQYRVAWLNGSGGIVGTFGWVAFNGGNGDWTQINSGPTVAPANAVNALIEVFSATGGISNDFGGVLIDDLALNGFAAGDVINTLSPTVQNAEVFAAAIKVNGVTATDAFGTIQFKTNGVVQSLKTVENGGAFSDPVMMPASYTVTATYFGDATYIGSMAVVVVGNGGVNPAPTNIMRSISNNQLTLSWPADRIGWALQWQSNIASVIWYDVPGSIATNQMTFPIDRTKPTLFYRMKYAP
jgi:hypothetical protein